MTDLKLGICPTAFWLNQEQCCWSFESGNCSQVRQISNKILERITKIIYFFLFFCTVENVVGVNRHIQRRRCSLYNFIFFLHNMGIIFCIFKCVISTYVCTVCMRFWYTWNQNDPIGLHHSKLFGQMDVTCEVCWSNAISIGWFMFGKRRSHGSHCQLHWYVSTTVLIFNFTYFILKFHFFSKSR